MHTRILVASDGKAGSRGALRIARLLSDRTGGQVEVLAVYESTDLFAVASPDEIAALPPHYLPDAVEALRSRVRVQIAEAAGADTDWPLTVAMGSVAPTIARFAARQHATMILVGLRQPGAFEQWFARETLLRLIHLAHVPVFAVPAETLEPPRRVVLGVDFSDFSLEAAREVIQRFGPGLELHLAHANWTPAWTDSRSEWSQWDRTYRAGVEARLEQFAENVRKLGDATVTTHVLSGVAGTEILRLADEVEADLIAAGSHGAGFIGRILMGSVSGKLVHRATRPLLIVPPREIPSELGIEMTDSELLANLGTAGELALPRPQ